MIGEFLAFSIPIAREGVSLTEDQVEARCNAILRELKTLIPAIAQLKSSRLVHAIAVRGGELVADFYLESARQDQFPFQIRGRTSPTQNHAAVWNDYQMLLRSLKDTELRMAIIARDLSTAGSHPVLDDPDLPLRHVMARRKGQTLGLGEAQGQLHLEFPDAPNTAISERSFGISCRVVSLSKRGLTVNSVSLPTTGHSYPAISASRQFLFEYPSEADCSIIANAFVKTIFDRKIVVIDGRVCIEPLTSEIRYFLMDGSHGTARRI